MSDGDNGWWFWKKNHLGLRSGFSLVGFCLDFWGGLVTIMWCLMLRCKISGKLWLLKSVESTPEQRKAPKAWSSTEIEGVCLVHQDDNDAYCDIKTTALCRIWWLKISPKPSQTTKPPFLTSWAAPSALSAPDWGDLVRGPQWSGEGEKSWKSSAKQRKRSKTSQETLARKTTSRSKQTNKKHQQNFFKDEKFSPRVPAHSEIFWPMRMDRMFHRLPGLDVPAWTSQPSQRVSPLPGDAVHPGPWMRLEQEPAAVDLPSGYLT